MIEHFGIISAKTGFKKIVSFSAPEQDESPWHGFDLSIIGLLLRESLPTCGKYEYVRLTCDECKGLGSKQEETSGGEKKQDECKSCYGTGKDPNITRSFAVPGMVTTGAMVFKGNISRHRFRSKSKELITPSCDCVKYDLW